MNDLVKRGSQTAKGGFRNEDDVVRRFNDWANDSFAQEWLIAMSYKINEIEYVRAEKVKGGYKADIQVQIVIAIKLKRLTDVQNLQVKLASNLQGFNQIDKRWVDKYAELWNIPQNITKLLKFFTGEMEPKISSLGLPLRDPRRMFIDELTPGEQRELIRFLQENKTLIISDVLKGRGNFSAEWLLVILRTISVVDNDNDSRGDCITNDLSCKIKWALKPMNVVMNLYGNGEVQTTKQGNIKLGRITMQRKGGDAGRDTAKMLQFKINPCLLLD